MEDPQQQQEQQHQHEVEPRPDDASASATKPQLRMQHLQADALHQVLRWLQSPQDLCAVALTCHSLRAAALDPTLWQRLCERKWREPHRRAHPHDARRLFATSNGLLDTPLEVDVISMAPGDRVRAAPSVVVVAGVGSGQQDPAAQVLVASPAGDHVHVMGLAPAPSSPSRQRADAAPAGSTSTSSANHQEGAPWTPATHAAPLRPSWHLRVALPRGVGPLGPQHESSAAALCPGGGDGQPHLLAVGTQRGALHVYHLPDSAGATPAPTVAPLRPHASAQHSTIPLTELLWLRSGGAGGPPDKLAVLADQWMSCMSEHGPAAGAPPANNANGQRNGLRLLAAETLQPLTAAPVHDVMEGWQLITMAPLDPGAAAEQALVVGSVAGPPCSNCWNAALPHLCYHKPHVRSAALCMVDARVPSGLAARFQQHHRSLYPRMQCARQRYILTSHASRPLVIWDVRAMSVPVFEHAELDRSCRGPLGCSAQHAAQQQHHHQAHEHQGLWLAASDDVLVGRSDNGCTWVWDLAAVLGWADGRGLGWWEALEDVPSWVAPALGQGGWPRCLGWAPPGGHSLPSVSLIPGRGALSMLALSSKSVEWRSAEGSEAAAARCFGCAPPPAPAADGVGGTPANGGGRCKVMRALGTCLSPGSPTGLMHHEQRRDAARAWRSERHQQDSAQASSPSGDLEEVANRLSVHGCVSGLHTARCLTQRVWAADGDGRGWRSVASSEEEEGQGAEADPRALHGELDDDDDEPDDCLLLAEVLTFSGPARPRS